MAVMEVAELTTTPLAGKPPKKTWASRRRSWSPRLRRRCLRRWNGGGAETGDGGSGARLTVNWVELLVAEVPAGDVTETSQTPAGMAGVKELSWVSELVVKLSRVVFPKLIWETSENPVPVRVTRVPPAVLPWWC